MGQEVHLEDGWNNWNGGYLYTRGEEHACLCVSTHDTWNENDDPATAQWKFVFPDS